MEDMTNILWFLLIGASALISFIAKRNEEKKKQQNESHEQETNPHEGREIPAPMPSMPPFGSVRPTQENPTPSATQRGESSRPQRSVLSQPEERATQPAHTTQPVSEPLHPMQQPKHKRQNTSYTGNQPQEITSERLKSESYSPKDTPFCKENPNASDTSAFDTQENPILDGFDLQKAVVWSEILKPKFSDESL